MTAPVGELPIQATSAERPGSWLPGLIHPGTVHDNLALPALVEAALARGEGFLTDQGALVASTGLYTGRSPRDRYLVLDPASQDAIDRGRVNQPVKREDFDRVLGKVQAFLQGRDVFV